MIMNKIVDLIGKNLPILGILLLSGFLATAGVLYFGVPGPTRANAAASSAADDCSNCEHHAALKAKTESAHAGVADACCPSETVAGQPPASCPASAMNDAHAGHDHAH
jgi:hypothetical protein